MKKYFWIIIIIVVLALWYVFMSKKTIPNTIISSGVVVKDFNLAFDIPSQRIVSIQPNRLSNAIHFRLSTQYKDTKWYQVFIDVTLQEDVSYVAQIKNQYTITWTIPEGKTMDIACDGVTPSSCLAIYSSGHAYVIGASAMTLQPQDPNTPSTITMQNYNQVLKAIQDFLSWVRIIK